MEPHIEKESEQSPQPEDKKKPSYSRTFSRTSIKAIVINVGIVMLLCGGCVLFIKPASTALVIGLLLYFILSSTLKMILLHTQRAGMRLVRMKRYPEAQAEFERSLQYFRDHEWADKYRAIIMLDTSAVSYTEMAINNIAYCLCCQGKLKEARTYYEQLEKADPNSELAKIGYHNIETLETQHPEMVVEEPEAAPAAAEPAAPPTTGKKSSSIYDS